MDAMHPQGASSFWDRLVRAAAGGKKDPRLIDYVIATGALIAGSVSLAIVSIAIIWAIDVRVPLRITGPEFAENKEVEVGEALVVVRNYCVDRPIKGVVERRIVDGVVWTLPAIETTGETGCFRNQRFLIDLPEAIPPGEYRYHVTIRYALNPINTRTAAHVPVSFRIVPKKQ